MRRSAAVFLIAFSSTLAGCLPGSESSFVDQNVNPADEVFTSLLEAIETRRPENFAALASPTCQPDRDTLFRNLSEFYKVADNVEYSVTVERRLVSGSATTYVFEWSRKHTDRTSSEVVTTRGRSEWTIDGGTGRMLLQLMAGNDLF